jgi:hypothetical protein
MKYYIISLEDEIAEKVENDPHWYMGVDEVYNDGSHYWRSFIDEVEIPEEVALKLLEES